MVMPVSTAGMRSAVGQKLMRVWRANRSRSVRPLAGTVFETVDTGPGESTFEAVTVSRGCGASGRSCALPL